MKIGRRVLVVSSLGLWLGAFAGGPAEAIEGFKIRAVAAGATVEFNQPGSPIPAQPTGEFHQAYSDASHETGPIGHGLSSALWPGSTAANAGSFFGGPNYPVRAEAYHPAGPPEQSMNKEHGQVLMEARSNENETAAVATTQGAPGGPAVETGSMRSTATSAVEGDQTVATATAAVTDVVLGGGAVLIDSVVTKAKATSDGLNGTVDGKTVVKGVTVATSGGEVGSTGITIGGAPLPIPIPDTAPVEDALTQAGITLKVAKPVDKMDGASASRTMGGLVITFAPGTAGVPAETTVTYHLAAVTVSANATPPQEEFDVTVPAADPPATTESGTTTGSSGGSPVVPAAPPAGAPFEDTVPVTPTEIATEPVSGDVPLPVAAVPIVLGVIAGVGSALGGKLLGGLATGALSQDVGPVCPLGKQ